MRPAGHKGRVYVVDDDGSIRASLQFLVRSAGFRVTAFDDGATFLAAAPSLQAGCVLLDFSMPDLNGLEILAKLHLPVDRLSSILMTGRSDAEIVLDAIRLGACDVVEKPFAREAILDAIRLAEERRVADVAKLYLSAAVRLERLARQERKFLHLLGEVPSIRTAAILSNVEPGRADVVIGRLIDKLNVHSLAQALRIVADAKKAVETPEDELRLGLFDR